METSWSLMVEIGGPLGKWGFMAQPECKAQESGNVH